MSKLGAGERNVAVWWTMVIAAADIERRRQILPKTLLSGGKTFLKWPHLSHGHTDLLKKQNARRGRGAWQK